MTEPNISIDKNNRILHLESFWSLDKDKKDSNNNKFPNPREVPHKKWTNQQHFSNRLIQVQSKSDIKFIKYDTYIDCMLCDKKNVTTGHYIFKNTLWQDSLIHYIEVHDIKPSNYFIDIIFRSDNNILNKRETLKIESKTYTREELQYLKIERNQVLIMDALMEHGGYQKKYLDRKDESIIRYSEHTGLLDFDNGGLEKIIISAKTDRVDKGDNEIYMPKNIPEQYEYEYMFHTHPPTPDAGGRVKEGVLYEFPSPSDIFHFLEHYNNGKSQGSIVIAPEGMYNIRKYKFNKSKIKMSRHNEDNLFRDLRKLYRRVQKTCIDKYGVEIDKNYFYSEIAQNTQYIDEINNFLHDYDLHIDYYPRQKIGNNWLIDTVYLPVFVIEQK
jgi:hypothetical protein